VRAPFSEVFIFALAVVFALATGERHRRAPQTPRRALPPPGHARCEWNPIMMQACQNGRGRPRIIRRNAERPRTITRGSIHAREYHLSAAGPPRRARHRRRPNPPCLAPSRRRSAASATVSPIA
jgi:hypothetical protein